MLTAAIVDPVGIHDFSTVREFPDIPAQSGISENDSQKVVKNDMNFARGRLRGHDLAQEGNKLLAGVPNRCLSGGLTGLWIQRGVQRHRPVTIVFKAMSFGSRMANKKGAGRTEFLTPLPNRLIGHDDSSLGKKILNVRKLKQKRS